MRWIAYNYWWLPIIWSFHRRGVVFCMSEITERQRLHYEQPSKTLMPVYDETFHSLSPANRFGPIMTYMCSFTPQNENSSERMSPTDDYIHFTFLILLFYLPKHYPELIRSSSYVRAHITFLMIPYIYHLPCDLFAFSVLSVRSTLHQPSKLTINYYSCHTLPS